MDKAIAEEQGESMSQDYEKPPELPPIEVPAEILSSEILDSLIEEFILREGTDYGKQEVSLEKKKEQVQRQLKNRQIKIMFDPNSESVTLLTTQQFAKITGSNK